MVRYFMPLLLNYSTAGKTNPRRFFQLGLSLAQSNAADLLEHLHKQMPRCVQRDKVASLLKAGIRLLCGQPGRDIKRDVGGQLTAEMRLSKQFSGLLCRDWWESAAKVRSRAD